MIDGEADVTFWVSMSLLLKLLNLLCFFLLLLLLWINSKDIFNLLVYSSSGFAWLSAKFCSERTCFLFNCFFFVYLFYSNYDFWVYNLNPKYFSLKIKAQCQWPCCIKAVTIDELLMGNELEVVNSS